MSVRRKLTAISLGKIACVAQPCQEHATVAIFKRAPGDPALALAKKSFEEALNAQLVSEQIGDVFWKAFEKSYAVREAFRTALADELAEGGDGSAATEGFTKAMQTIAESAAALAREAGTAATPDLESAVEQAVEKWLKQQETSEMKITTKAALKAAVAAFAPATSTVADRDAILKAATDLNAEDELPVEGPLAKAQQDPALAKALSEIAILKMSPEVRKHYDGLAETAQSAFLAKSAADQQAEVDAANATDPVVYKTAGGIEIRKSDGATAVLMAKQMDEQQAEITKLRAGAQTDGLEKRASAFPNVAKSVAIDLLKSIDQVGADTDAGKALTKSLATMNKSGSGLMKSFGTTEGDRSGPGDVNKARTDFNAKCAEIAKRDSVGPADAMSKARVEFPDLFSEAYPENAEAEDAEA